MVIGKKELAFLKMLYDFSGGNALENVSSGQIINRLGIKPEDSGEILGNLIVDNLIESQYLRDYIQLTIRGKSYIEEKIIQNPSIPQEKKEKYYVFISHITENEYIAEKLKEYFIQIFNEKIEIFVAGDPKSIPISEDWFETVLDGIRNCDLMIVFCSPESVKRPWINFETGAAKIFKNKKIGPICFAGQRVGKLPPPFNFIRSQAVDVFNEKKFKTHFDGLIRDIAEKLDITVEVMNVLDSEFYSELRQAGSGSPPILPKVF